MTTDPERRFSANSHARTSFLGAAAHIQYPVLFRAELRLINLGSSEVAEY